MKERKQSRQSSRTITITVSSEGEALLLEQFHAICSDLKSLARNTPNGQVLDQVEMAEKSSFPWLFSCIGLAFQSTTPVKYSDTSRD